MGSKFFMGADGTEFPVFYRLDAGKPHELIWPEVAQSW